MKNLIKPFLTYASIVALSASATMCITETNKNMTEPKKVSNISGKIANKPEITQAKVSQGLQPNTSKDFNNEFWCLKVLGWHEIREGSEYAMKAVYSVVENRKNSGSYPNTYCGVMKQKWQFSFWNKGKYNIKALEPKPKNPIEVAALKKIESISMQVVTGKFNPVLPSSVMWYSTPAAKRDSGLHWTNQFTVATKAGPHLFYRQGLQEI